MLMVVDMLFYNIIFGRGRKDPRLVAVAMLLRYCLPLITILLTLYLSRIREYMADAGAVELMRDNKPMVNALKKIAGDHEQNHEEYKQAYNQTANEEIRRAAYLFDPATKGMLSSQPFTSLFSTHPPINERLKALGYKTSN